MNKLVSSFSPAELSLTETVLVAGQEARYGRMDNDTGGCQCLLCTMEEYDRLSSGHLTDTVLIVVHLLSSHRTFPIGFLIHIYLCP